MVFVLSSKSFILQFLLYCVPVTYLFFHTQIWVYDFVMSSVMI
jgi:hypothetical protein